MTTEQLKEKVKKLPLKPGVYIMMDSRGEVIYVGKAKALKNRVSQYFNDLASHTPKTRSMVSQIDDFDIIVAASEFEALVLECSLIKRHRPKYNILLKDDKGYPFVRLSDEPYPRFSLVNRRAEDGARYFGPFGSRGTTHNALDAIRTALGLPTCSRRFPRDIGRERPCLEWSMGRCAGWCLPERSREDYLERIGQAVSILKGDTAGLAGELTDAMTAAAEQLRFEKAAELRDRLKAVEGLKTRQKAFLAGLADTDVIGWHRTPARACFAVLHYIDGALLDKDFVLLPPTVEQEDGEILSGLLKQYYLSRGFLPRKVLLPFGFEDRADIARLLTESGGTRVELSVARRGEALSLSKLAELNAREEIERVTTAEERTRAVLELLQKALGLMEPPRRIEAYDISTVVRGEMVGAMTVYANGRPCRGDYRSFVIKNEKTHDDYSAMAEVLRRRFTHYRAGDNGFDQRPDLLLIDGGSVHAATAAAVLREFGLDIPVYGMVKDDRHRTRAIAAPDGREIGIRGTQALFSFVGSIQEETHRRAIELHRKRREKSHGSSLDAVPGVGPKRRSELLKHFGSVSAVKRAALEQLEQAVPKNTARSVYEYYHGKEQQI